MDDDWETVADQDLVIRPPITKNVNRWAGEDDEDDVKESWEMEEEKKDEEKPEIIPPVTPGKPKPSKAQLAKMAEEERLKEEEEEQRLENMTSEEKLAEKLRLQKIQEESDLKSALDTFGIPSSVGLDSYNPQSKEDFKEYGSALSWKLSQYKESPHYSQFIEDLVRNICAPLPSSDIKKVKITVETLYTEKLKTEKQNTKKPSTKSKAKITIRKDSDDINDYKKYGGDYDDYDDFM